MRGLRCVPTVALLAALAPAPAVAQPGAPERGPAVRVEVEPREATVGDRIEMRLEVEVPPATGFSPPQLGPQLGPFSVLEAAWAGPRTLEQRSIWTWTAQLSAFRTGELEIPPLRLVLEDAAGDERVVSTEPLTVRIVSVLEADSAGADPPPLADLKPPASLPPNYRPLLVASGLFALLLLAAAVLWWLHRRYAARLAVVPVPDDPFRRTPPHVWVYAELQKLLDRRLAEEGRATEFFEELSRILKRYLEGRFRVDLLERTTSEVPHELRQAGAPPSAIRQIEQLLVRSDMVKFARQAASLADCRAAIEAAYGIVDETKPAGADEPQQGAA